VYNLGLKEVIRHSDIDNLFHELKPNSEVIFTGQFVELAPTRIKISSQGIRDYEYAVKKGDNVYRIIILGDSVAFGWGVKLEDTFAKYLERLLNSEGQGKIYEVINFAVPGYNMLQEVITLKEKCLKYEPDLVIFHVVGNDYIPLFNHIYPMPIFKFLPEFFFNSRFFRWLATRVVFDKEKDLLNQMEKGMRDVEIAVRQVKSICDKNMLQVLFYSDVGWLKPVLEEYDLMSWVISPDERVYKATFKEDKHANAYGHQLIGERIYDDLKERGILGS